MKKKIGFTLFGLLVVVLAAAIVLPIIYKDKIKAIALKAVNEKLNAQISFGDISVSLFRDFPHFSMSVEDFMVIGVDTFALDTLARVGDFSFSMNIMPIIRGEDLNIRKIRIADAKIHVRVLASGQANYDIMKPDTAAVVAEDTTTSDFRFAIQSYSLKNVDVIYDDRFYAQKAVLLGINHEGSGDFTLDDFVLKTKTEIQSVSYTYAGMTFISQATAKLEVPIAINMPAFSFTFTDNDLYLNELNLKLSGVFAMPADDMVMDMKFNTPQSDFKALLSVVPGMFDEYFKDIQTKGKFVFDGMLKGTYNDNSMPAFNFVLGVDKGYFQYPSLPAAVNDIMMDLKITNATGDLDATIVDLKQFGMDMAGNPIDFRLYTTKPISDPTINAALNASIDFDKVKRFIPGDMVKDLTGKFSAAVTANGRVNAIEQQKYNDITVSGEMMLEQFFVSSTDFQDGVKIERMAMAFSPQFVALRDFNAKMGTSDIRASGRIDNLLSYYFGEEKLKGSFNVNSNLLNLNELMGDATETTADSPATESASLTVIEIPNTVDFKLNANFKKVLYDNMEITNLQGNLYVRDQKLGFDEVGLNLLGGSIQTSGSYNTQNIKKPAVAFNIGMQDFDVKETFSTFVTMQKIAPIGQYTSGRFSTGFELNGFLLQDMTPDLNSLQGGGLMKIPNATISGFKPLEKAADMLRMNNLKSLSLKNVNLSFEFDNGRVYVQPFEIEQHGIKMIVSGSNGFDLSIDYTLQMEVPRELLGPANTLVNGLLSKAAEKGVNVNVNKTVGVKVRMTGLVNDPKVDVSLASMTDGAGDDLKQQALDELERRKKELEDKARAEAEKAKAELEKQRQEAEARAKAELDKKKQEARAEADKILADAQVQANRIKTEGKNAADVIRREGEANANKLIAEAGSNPVKKAAAEKAAQGIRKQANVKAAQLEQEANQRADNLMAEARRKADEKLK